MRSIRTVKEGNKAKRDYYTKDKSLGTGQKAYYAKGEGKSQLEEMNESVWFGKDAERLNLRGHVQQSDFEQIYDGYIPGTQERIRGEKPRKDHKENCIYDLVLSCKKSVSMQIHLGKDEQLYEAYQETVLEIAELIQKDYAQAKRQVNGERHVIQTEGILAVLMPHHITRDLDMGVHTHLVIANGTYCEDGKWRSLRDVGFSHAYYMGDYFNARMAARVQELGYEIRETVTEQGHPSWELTGYTDEQIKVFSKRSENVEVKELIAKGYSRDDALMFTRKAKDLDESIEELQERWGIEAQEHGIEAVIPKDHAIAPKRETTAEQILESAIRHFSHNSVHFSRDEIREYAFKLNRTFNLEQLDQAIAKHPELIDYGKFGNLEDFQGHFTTAQALEREIRTVKAWMQGQGKATAVMERETSAQALEIIQAQPGQRALRSGQREAVIGVLASSNQHQVIHGLSGVGKTTALKQLRILLDSKGIEILGLAPSIPAAKTLGKEMGIETQTVQKIVKSKQNMLKPGQLIVIDESGMNSANMLDVVLQKANAVGARVLLVGDTGQNQAIEAGSPMRSVMAHGAQVHHISEIIRQQDEVQKRAVELIADGRGLDALSLLNEHKYINAIEERDERVSAIADEFMSLSVAEQADTLIVAGTNEEKDAINLEIRSRQKAQGFLGESVKVTRIQGEKPTPEAVKDIQTYRVGQELSIKRGQQATTKNDPYKVMAVEGDELVLLRTSTDTLYRFNPQFQKFVGSVNVTQLRDRKLSPEQTQEVLFYRVGDFVSLSRDYKSANLHKNIPYQVVAKDKDELVVSTAGGRLYRFNPQHYKDKKVFSAHEFDVAVGDSLRWTQSDRDKGEINGETIQITAINGHWATALTEKGEVLEIDLKRPLAVDYTLTSTSYRIQGSDRLRVLMSATNDRTSNREPFYVAISRQIKFLKIWAEDYEGLKRRVAESSVQLNPLELLNYGNVNINQSSGTTRDSSRNAGDNQAGDDTLGTGVRNLAGEPKTDWQPPSRNGGSDQKIAEASGRQERHLSNGGAIGQNGGSGFRDSESDRTKVRSPDNVDRGTSGIQAIADEIVRIRLQRELAEPLARLQVRLSELRELKQLNDIKQANIAAKLQEVLTCSKVEVLSTTLEDWRSFREDDSVLPHIEEISNSDAIKLSELVENYPAQKAIEFAMAEYYQASNQVIDLESSLKTGTPVFRLDELLARSLSNKSKEVDRPVTQTIDRPKRQRPVNVEQRNAIRALTRPESPNKRTQKLPSTAPKSTKLETFWTPDYSTATRPDHIDEKHWNEWVDSQVHPELIKVRLKSIEGQQVIERLLEKKLEFLGSFEKVGKEWQRRKVGSQYANSEMRYEMNRYQSVADGGGWWVNSGENPLSFPDLKPGDKPLRSSYGTFKPNEPRIDNEKTARKRRIDPNAEPAVIKYENPVGTKQELFERDLSFNPVPDAIASQIFEKYGVIQTQKEKEFGFWYTVYQHPEIPIYRVEGDKKDAAVTSQGRVVISGQGVNAGYRSKDQHDVKLPERVLHPQLEMFAVPGREIRYAFDADENVNAILNVRRDMVREAELVEARGSLAFTIPWKPEQGKGVDDLIKISGPIAFEKADLNAKPIESAANTHYRTEYNRIVRQVRKDLPDLPPEHLDVEVYLRAIAKGELKDGDRVLSQSDHARTLKDPEQVQQYIEQVKTKVPEYRQYKRSIAAAKAQNTKDRKVYKEIAQSVKAEIGDLKPEQLDVEISLRLGLDNPNLERILGQSDRAKSCPTPEDKTVYIQSIQNAALQVSQTREAVQAQQAQDRSEYETLAKRVRNTPAKLSTELVDTQIHWIGDNEGQLGDGDRLIAQSDHARSLSNPQDVLAYVEHIRAEAQLLLERIRENGRISSNRWSYEHHCEQVTQERGVIPAEQLDMEVYLRVQSNGEDVTAILAQSDHARSLSNPEQVTTYLERIKTQAPQYKQQQIEAQAQAQRQAIALAAERAQRDGDRVLYLSTANEVKQTLGNLTPEKLDVEVYRKLQAIGADPDRILTQSDRAQKLGNPVAVKVYVERLKGLGLEQVKHQTEEQHRLNMRAFQAGKALLSHVDSKTPDGWNAWLVGNY
jgi:conjugative relaxase-like TrwC/TraI family protein